MIRVRPHALAAVVALGVMAIPAGIVHADPAGPTDYRSEVVALTPAVSGFSARVIGGDSFLEVTAPPGVEVLIPGYAGEPYLRIDTEGRVWENQRSPARWYNRERFGGEIPASADPTAEPEWTQIGSGGRWAWHDHRIHRMEEFPPLNARRSDQVLDARVPVRVGDVDLMIAVVSRWMPAPSPLPMIAGVGLGLAALIGPWRARREPHRRLRAILMILAPMSLGALVLGVWQFASLPGSTDPLFTWWLLPLIALISCVSATFSLRGALLSASAAVAIAGSQLLVWGVGRREGLWRAVLPTDAPWWLDRLVTAAAMPVAAVALIVGGGGLLAALRPGSVRTAPPRSPA